VNERIFSLVILFAIMLLAQGRQTFTGVITDSMCANGDHSAVQMGPTDAECTNVCIDSHGASYVLYDGKQAYFLSDQKTPEKFAGKKVVVTGTIDAAKKTIHVEMIALASSNH
jgi:hypothetical protein